ncbi:MAG: NfeD family protein [Anaerolineae bacterium]
MPLLDTLTRIVSDPNVVYVLLTLGIIGVVVELYSPGGIVPGLAGVIALALAFVGLGNLPVNWTGLGLILLAFVLFVLDIQVSGFLLSAAGVAAFIVGSLLLFSPPARAAPMTPPVRVSPALVAGMTALLATLVGVLLTAAVRAQQRVPVTGAQAMVGKRGIALSALAPEGIVRVQSETWTALAVGGEIGAGETVEVTGIQGLRLTVRHPS